MIDAGSMTMFFVARTVQGTSTVHTLRAVDITTGNDRAANASIAIQATVPGTGDGSSGGQVAFNPKTANQRMSLALSGGVVYVGWSSFCDTGPYHGWLMAYQASTLAQVGVFNVTPNGGAGGIWQAGAAPAFDASGNLYVSTGNGTFDGNTNFSQSV